MIASVFSQILDLVSETIILVDSSDTIVFCNHKAPFFENLSENDLVGHSFPSLVSQITELLRTPEALRLNVQKVANNPYTEWSCEFDLVDGESLSVVTKPILETDASGSRVWCFISRTKVSSVKEDDQHKLLKYLELFHSAPFGIIHYGPDGKIIDANPAVATILGYETQTQMMDVLNNVSVRNAVFKKKQKVFDMEQKASEEPGVWVMDEAKLFRKDGTMANCELFLRVTKGEEPTYQIIFSDAGSLKKAESISQENYKRMKASFQLLKDLINSHTEDLQNTDEVASQGSLPNASRLLELNYIEGALRKTRGKVQPAARLLGISRYALIRQIAKMGIDPKKYR